MKDELIQIGGKSYKECEVVTLPTEDKTQITKAIHYKNELRFAGKDYECLPINEQYQHLYILSSEEIKEGDWVFDSYDVCVYQIKDFTSTNYHQRKIIATTDTSILLKGGRNDFEYYYTGDLARPSDDFLKAYVKAQGKGFDKVLVEMEEKPVKELSDMYSLTHQRNLKFKVAPDNTITIKPVQEEKTSLTEKEVMNLLFKFAKSASSGIRSITFTDNRLLKAMYSFPNDDLLRERIKEWYDSLPK